MRGHPSLKLELSFFFYLSALSFLAGCGTIIRIRIQAKVPDPCGSGSTTLGKTHTARVQAMFSVFRPFYIYFLVIQIFEGFLDLAQNPILRIYRIHFFADPDPAVFLNGDPDPQLLKKCESVY